MAEVVRLESLVDTDDEVLDARQISMSVRHVAVLDDGRHVLLLGDRGWSASGPSNIWAVTTVEEIAETARTVVGPDEPFGEHTPDDMNAGHWTHLANILLTQGVAVDAGELDRLRHDVVLSDRLRTRIGKDPNSV